MTRRVDGVLTTSQHSKLCEAFLEPQSPCMTWVIYRLQDMELLYMVSKRLDMTLCVQYWKSHLFTNSCSSNMFIFLSGGVGELNSSSTLSSCFSTFIPVADWNISPQLHKWMYNIYWEHLLLHRVSCLLKVILRICLHNRSVIHLCKTSPLT